MSSIIRFVIYDSGGVDGHAQAIGAKTDPSTKLLDLSMECLEKVLNRERESKVQTERETLPKVGTAGIKPGPLSPV